jgi:hypothetical protein
MCFATTFFLAMTNPIPSNKANLPSVPHLFWRRERFFEGFRCLIYFEAGVCRFFDMDFSSLLQNDSFFPITSEPQKLHKERPLDGSLCGQSCEARQSDLLCEKGLSFEEL